MNKVNAEDFKDKVNFSWFERLKPFFESEDCYNLYQQLRERKAKGNTILPVSMDTFRAFKKTNPHNIKAIIITNSPYSTINKRGMPYADGLAFSCRLTKEISPVLKEIYNSLSRDYNKKFYEEPNLDYLAEQGVLLLHSSYTTELNKIGIHEDLNIWESFNNFLYKNVLDSYCGVPVLCIGDGAKKISKLIFPLCNKIKCIEHPSKAIRENREWNNENCFKWIDHAITENNGPFNGIEWDYMEYQDIPF